jgi:hypothetical protein
MMQRFKQFAWWAMILSFFGCNGAKPNQPETAVKSDSLVSTKFSNEEVSWEPTYATFATYKKGLILKDSDMHRKEDRLPAVVHDIYLANYDLQMTDAKKQDYKKINSAGQYRVEIRFEAKADAPENVSLQVGEHTYKQEPYNRISSVFIAHRKDNADYNEFIRPEQFVGNVTITSVTDREIKGEIDVSDKQKFVKGKFTAQRLNP